MLPLRLTTLAVFASTCVYVGVIAAQEGPAPHKPSEGPATFVPKDSVSPISLASSPSNTTPTTSASSDSATTETTTTEAATTEDDQAKKIDALPTANAAPSVKPSAKPYVAEMPKLMSAAKEARLRKLLPKVDDPALAAILESRQTMFYTDDEMPKAYQFYNGAFPGLHSVHYNISANGSEPFGNGNLEFPWSGPAGTHRCNNLFTFRFLHLPLDEHGNMRPVVYHPSSQGGHSWTFPVGTVFGEVLVQLGPKGVGYTFELRTRKRESGDWDSDAFRPFPTTADLAAKIRELEPEWESKKDVAALLSHLEKPLDLKTRTLADSQPQGRTFHATMGVDPLPALKDEKLVAKLLTQTTFTSAKEKYWRVSSKKDDVVAVAPTSTASFHIVPKDYDAGFVEVDKQSCMRCHETTNKDVDNFDAGRDWYGRVRGSDGVFSFHPFEPSSMSYNGFSSRPSMRSSFEQAGVIARFSKALHPRTIYNRIRNLAY